ASSLAEVDCENRRPILSSRKIDEDWREAALADLLGRKVPHVVSSSDDEYARMRIGQPAEQRADHAARRAAVRAVRGLHATYCLVVFGHVEHAFSGCRDLERAFDGQLGLTEQSPTFAHYRAEIQLEQCAAEDGGRRSRDCVFSTTGQAHEQQPLR